MWAPLGRHMLDALREQKKKTRDVRYVVQAGGDARRRSLFFFKGEKAEAAPAPREAAIDPGKVLASGANQTASLSETLTSVITRFSLDVSRCHRGRLGARRGGILHIRP